MGSFFNDLNKAKKYWNWKRIRNNIRFLIKNDIEDEKYMLKDEAIEDAVYEFEELSQSIKHLKVLNEIESIEMLSEKPKSFARYGDGEINVMNGEDTAFQKYDSELARKMKKLLIEKKDNLYVGLNSSYFQSPVKYSARNRKFYRLYGTKFRRFFTAICDPENVYLDACCWGGYFRQGENFDLDEHYKNVRNLFKNKKIAIVCGEGILDKLDYDVFDQAEEKMFVNAPKRDAFSKYQEIIEEIEKRVPKDWLICIILGMTATVLAADLADLGYIAWDVGHVAKDYNAYMNKTDKTEEVMDAFFAPD